VKLILRIHIYSLRLCDPDHMITGLHDTVHLSSDEKTVGFDWHNFLSGTPIAAVL